MLNNELKKNIQTAYSTFLSSKSMKPRYGQKLMIAEIAKTLGNIELDEEGGNLSENSVAVIEAGTGTGKTVAYLLATIPIAQSLDKKVILSTATIALQEQVMVKDVPDILQHSGLGFSFTLAKGRGRYLCLNKLERILADASSGASAMYEDEVIVVDEQDLSLYHEMMQKSVDGEWDGDKDNWEDELAFEQWSRVVTDHRQCMGRKCPNIRDCAFFNARNSLEEADLIIANHDLVLSDLALGGGAILPAPEQSIYVFDEGHHLPDKTLNHFAAHTRYRSTIRWLGQSEGQWPNHCKALDELTYFKQLAEPLEQKFKAARSVLEQALPYVNTLCENVELDKISPRKQFPLGETGSQLEAIAEDAARTFFALTEILEKLHLEIEALINDENQVIPKKELEVVLMLLGSWLTRSEANQALWQSYRQTTFNHEAPFARWITLMAHSEPVDYEFVSSPILASGLLNHSLWSRCCGAVVTSATIRALNSFERFQMRSGLSVNVNYQVVPSPFDYQNNVVLSIPPKAVEANNSVQHTESLIQLLPEVIDENKATLVLFSSHAQMNQVYEAMPERMQKIIFCQGYESKQRIIAAHKRRVDRGEGSVIWGLASFAEGVDLPGRYCEHVVIAKLPFAVPDEPLEAAYSEWVEACGGNAFMDVSVPDTSTRLIQACGRLLRTETDSGKISIMDKRLTTKRYGAAILSALPPFSRDF